ncbi:MAG: SDR family oxidoreductase [Candidatus Omnitrophica bacterium]|nr:SDR family oxidoreductase [Candidatus Omnitrophota bacterium]
MEYKIFENKNCFISGATGGIGSQIAMEMAKNGCNLFLTATNMVKLKTLKNQIQSIQGKKIKIFYAQGDLNEIQDVKQIIKAVKKQMGKIDILVNVAGIFVVKDFLKYSLDDFQESFNVNLRAAFMFCQVFSKDMVKEKWGRIINIGSSSAYSGCKRTVLYCASKHALLGFSRALHDELKKFNIRTFCVSPSGSKTKMGKLIENQNFETFLDPQEIAKYITFISSFDGKMVSEEIRLNRLVI